MEGALAAAPRKRMFSTFSIEAISNLRGPRIKHAASRPFHFVRRQRNGESQAPSTTPRVVPLPRFAGADAWKRSRDAKAPELCLFVPQTTKAGRRSADRRIQPCAPPLYPLRKRRREEGAGPRATVRSACANRPLRARSPFGAPAAALAKAFTSWLSFGSAFPGTTGCKRAFGPLRCQCSDAPRRPVIVPADRFSEAARERDCETRPQAPQPAPHQDRIRTRPLVSELIERVARARHYVKD